MSYEVSRFLISSFISPYYLITLFPKTDSLGLINESIKALEIRTSIPFTLVFARNTIISCFFFYFLTSDLYFLIPSDITQIFNPAAELAIPIRIRAKEIKFHII